MFVKRFRVGGDRNLGYLVADESTREAAVIDPSYAPERIVQFAREQGFDIVYVFNTHGHTDHTNGNATFERLTGLTALGYGAMDPRTEQQVRDGVKFPLGSLEITIIHTPGHSPDSVCLYVGDAVFTGDTLYVGKVGGTDYGQGAREEYHSLHEKLCTLPDKTRVFPGHDVGVAPESTIEHERKTNPFLLQPDFEAFVNLKRNWLAYKREHGIA